MSTEPLAIVVTDVKLTEITCFPHKLTTYDKPYLAVSKWANSPSIEDKYTTEYINGEEFIKPDGKRIVIGMSQAVQNSVGVVMSNFHRMSEDNMRLQASNSRLSDDVYVLESKLSDDVYILESKLRCLDTNFNVVINSGFWVRLKFLITGKIGW